LGLANKLVDVKRYLSRKVAIYLDILPTGPRLSATQKVGDHTCIEQLQLLARGGVVERQRRKGDLHELGEK
jgi:DNA-binding GntR family transcriptional regulator